MSDLAVRRAATSAPPVSVTMTVALSGPAPPPFMDSPAARFDLRDHPLATAFRCPVHPAAPVVRTADAVRCGACGTAYPLRAGHWDFAPPATTAAFADESRQWDEQAERYEDGRARDPLYMAGVRAAVRAVGLVGGRTVLDAGCGTGLIARELQRAGGLLAGVDASAASLARVDRGGGSPVLTARGDLLALPFAGGAFERVLCANAIQQIPTADARRRAVRELVRVVRPGGRVVVTVQAYSRRRRWRKWPKEGAARGPSGAVQYVYRFDPDEFAAMLSDEGLARVRITGAMFALPYRFKLSPLSRALEDGLARWPAAAPFGDMLVGVGVREPG